MKMVQNRRNNPILFLFVLFLVLVLWELVTYAFNVPVYILPSPTRIILNIFNNFNLLLKDTFATAIEAFLGLVLGISFGFIFATSFAHSRILEKVIYPYFVALQTIPIIAIAPLLVIWVGNGYFGKIIMASFICFFPIVVNTTVGLNSVDKNLIELFKIYNASKIDIFFKLRLPSSLPYFFSALKISTVLSIIGAIVAEMVGAQKGIGFRIVISSYRLDTEMMFSAIVISSLLGVFLSAIVKKIETIFLKWKNLN